MATEIASAYLSLYAKMPGVQNDIAKQLGSVDADKVGLDLGKQTSAGYTKGFALAGAVGGLVATIASSAAQSIGDLVGDAVAASDATAKFAQTLGFAGIDTTRIDQLQKSTKAYADSTVYDLATVQSTTAQLAANGVKDYDKLTEAAGNLNAVAGGNEDTFGSVAMMLTQTAGAGKLTTENWNQLADAIPGASGVMQDALEKAGAYTGNFRDAMEKGEISADEFNAALMELGSDPIAVEAAKSTETMEGALGSLNATIVGGLSTAISTMKPMLTGAIGFLADVLGGFFGWFQNAFTGIYEFLVNGDFTGALREAFGWQEDSEIVDFLFTVREAITGLWDLIVGGDFTGALSSAFGWEEDSEIVDMLLNARQAVIDFATSIPERLGAAFNWVKANTDWLVPIAIGVGAAVVAFKLWNGAIMLWQTITKTAAAVQLVFNAVMAANPIMLIVMAVAALVGGLVYFFTQTKLGQEVWANFTQFLSDSWANISQFFMETWGNISSFFITVWDAISGAITAAYNGVIKPIIDAIAAVFTWLYQNIIYPIIVGIMIYIGLWAALFTWLWSTILSPVLQAIGAAFTWVYESIIKPVFDGIGVAIGVVASVIGAVLAVISDVWLTVWGAISSFFGTIWAAIVSAVTTYINIVQTIITTVVGVISSVWNSIWSGISSFFKGIWDGIVKAVSGFGTFFQNAFSGIAGFVDNAFKGVLSAVKGPINAIIGLVNSAIDGLNGLSVTIPDWVPIVGGQTFGLSLPKIPRLAEGGIVSARPGGIIANIGEGRYDEAVVPLTPKFMESLSGPRGGGGGRPVHIDQHFTQQDPVLAMRAANREISRELAIK